MNSQEEDYSIAAFKKVRDSLSTSEGCLFYGARVVIPISLQRQVLEILHLGHFGMQQWRRQDFSSGGANMEWEKKKNGARSAPAKNACN